MDYLITGLTAEERQDIATSLGVGSLQKWEALVSRDLGDGKSVIISTERPGFESLQLVELRQFVDKLVSLGFAKTATRANLSAARSLILGYKDDEITLDSWGCTHDRGRRTFTLGPDALQRTSEVLGAGYGDKFFTLTWEGETLEGCTIDGGDGTVGYLKISRAD